jgi:protein-S-isoprenylcysteine O-methyltransferase Ste14
MKYFILSVLWVLFCVIHSGMISLTFTEFIKRITGNYYRFYRLFYNIISIAVLIPIVIYSYSIKEEPFFIWEGYLLPVKYFLVSLGILLFILGSKHYSLSSFLGLAQMKENINSRLMNETGKLDSSGILGIIRHPYYSGVIPLLWSSNLDYTTLIINIILTAYIFIGTLLEEKKLVHEFGNEYIQYQYKVSMLIPVKWITSKVH